MVIPPAVQRVLDRLEGGKRVGKEWRAKCPVHNGDGLSLTISAGDDGRALLHCFAEGCSAESIVAAIDLTTADLFPPTGDTSWTLTQSNGKAKKQSKTYPTMQKAIGAARYGVAKSADVTVEQVSISRQDVYHDAMGREAFLVVRFDFVDGKEFRPIHKSVDGWRIADPPGKLPLYGLPDIGNAERVYIVEGEKCAEALRSIGLTATTSAHGSKSAEKTDWTPLAGRECVVLPDNDKPGEGYAEAVAGCLAKLDPPATVRVVRLPDLPENGGDVADWIEARECTEPDELRAAVEKLADDAEPCEQLPFRFYTLAEFMSLDLRREYHIPGVLAAGGVPTILSGAMKTLKTSIGMDLLLSLATGSRFLNHYDVNQTRVGIMSGESGGFALQDLARRIGVAKGVPITTIGSTFHIASEVPDLKSPEHIAFVERFIRQHELGVFMIDPMYLAMKGIRSDDAGNLMRVGEWLAPLSVIGQRTNCTMIIVHHNSRGATRANPGEPAELADIAWSGFAEWAGQWLLLSRRERYDPDSDGEHRLWLTAGGRDGHSTLVGINVTEGRQDSVGGRRWEVEVEQAVAARREAIEAEQERREEANEQKRQKQVERDRERIVSIMRSLPNGDTITTIATLAGISGGRAGAALAEMTADGTVEPCEVSKSNGQKYDGFRLRESATPTHPDTPRHTPGQSG